MSVEGFEGGSDGSSFRGESMKAPGSIDGGKGESCGFESHQNCVVG